MHQSFKKNEYISVYSLPTEVMSKSSLSHLVAQSDGRGFSHLPVWEAPSLGLSSIFPLLNWAYQKTKRGEEEGRGGGPGEMSERSPELLVISALQLSDLRAIT